MLITYEQLEQAMEKALKRHFSRQLELFSQNSLADKILGRLALEYRLKKLKARLYAALTFFTATVAVFIFALDLSLKAFAQTSTFKFISLFFTDFKHIADYWQDYLFSVLETLPLGHLAFMLGALLAALLLAQYSFKQLSGFRKLSHSRV